MSDRYFRYGLIPNGLGVEWVDVRGLSIVAAGPGDYHDELFTGWFDKHRLDTLRASLGGQFLAIPTMDAPAEKAVFLGTIRAIWEWAPGSAPPASPIFIDEVGHISWEVVKQIGEREAQTAKTTRVAEGHWKHEFDYQRFPSANDTDAEAWYRGYDRFKELNTITAAPWAYQTMGSVHTPLMEGETTSRAHSWLLGQLAAKYGNRREAPGGDMVTTGRDAEAYQFRSEVIRPS